MKTGGEYLFTVRTYECGADASATLPSILNYLQEAASLNASALKFSKTDFENGGENISWVLARLKIEMERYPEWGDTVKIATFPRGGRRIVAWRDFSLETAAGVRLGAASSEWMLIDLAARKTVPVPESVLVLADVECAPVLGDAPFTAKIRFPAPATPAGEGDALRFKTLHSGIDMNGHVNNVHYAEWLLEPFAGRRPASFEIVFRSESAAGEMVSVETAAAPDGASLSRVVSGDGRERAVAKIAF